MKTANVDFAKVITVILGLGTIAFMFFAWYGSRTIAFQELALITGTVDEVRLQHTETGQILDFTVQSNYELKSFRCFSESTPSYGEVAELLVRGNEISVWYSPEKGNQIWQLQISRSWPQKNINVGYVEMRKEYQRKARFFLAMTLTFLAAFVLMVPGRFKAR